jgi:CxxC motif-containing protein (DUF1111 family)
LLGGSDAGKHDTTQDAQKRYCGTGSALTIHEAIRRHKGQAEEVTKKYLKLVEDHPEQARQLVAFLNSL